MKEASILNLSVPWGMEENIYNLTYETEISPVKIKATLGMVDRRKYQYIQPSASTSTRSGGPASITTTPSESYNPELQCTFPLWERHIFTIGGSFRHTSVDTKTYTLTNWRDEDSKTTLDSQAKGKAKNYALFFQDEIMILENLRVYPGFRQDWWEAYDGYANQLGASGKSYESQSESAFSPKFAVVYKPFGKTTLRTSAGKAFRPPSVLELYSVFILSGVVRIGNPDLKPETSKSWDIGIEQGLWKGAKIGATYFENYIKDLIYRQTVSPTLIEQMNVGKAESKGVELEVEQRFDNDLRLFANFTYTDAKMKENDAKPSTEGKKLTGVPEKMFNIGGDYTCGPFSASLVGRYMDKRYSDDENKDKVSDVYGSYDSYFVADARVSYKLTKFATLSFSVDNIFDKEYFNFSRAPGRSWLGEVTMRF